MRKRAHASSTARPAARRCTGRVSTTISIWIVPSCTVTVIMRAAATPAHMSTLEAILARMTARPTEKDVAEAERLQKVMAGAD